MEASPDDPAALLNDLIDRRWDTIARHAWRQYEERGRGAIVYPMQSTAADAPAATESRTPLRYLTFNNTDAAERGAFAKLHELVATYDPEREAVIAIVLPDDRTVFDVYRRSPAPPDAASD